MKTPHLWRRLPAVLLVLVLILTACSIGANGATPSPAPLSPTATAVTEAAAPSATLAGRGATAPATGTALLPATPAAVGAASPAARGTASPGRATPAPRSAVSTAVPNIAPTSASELVEQAVATTIEHYVDPISSADLFGVAYTSVLQTLGASGQGTQGNRAPPAFTGDQPADAARFRTAYLALMESAGAGLNQTVIAYEAIHAITEKIDECHTAFLEPEQYKLITDRLEGNQESYGGIGVSIRTQVRPVVIGELFPGTPAEKSGLLPGDAILAVDGLDVTNLPADQISPLVRGPEGTVVRLTVQRPGEAAPRDFTITRAKITVPVFTSRVIDGANGAKIGYMKLYSFSTGTEQEVEKALQEFKRQKVSGWIFDLRDNGGGYITTLSQISSRFFKDGPVAYTIKRNAQDDPIAINPRLLVTPQLPLAVLVNGGSASSSEAFASAIQDYGRGRLFGQTTSGCLAGAQTFPLSDGSAMQVTIYKVVSPKRREINRIGIEPDEVIQPNPTGANDPVIDGALQWLATQH